MAEERHLPVDVAPGSVHADDGVAAVRLPNAPHPLLDLVVGLVPRDTLPLVLAALSGAPHGVLQTVGMVQGLVERQALDAELAVRARIQWVALHTLHFAILYVQQNPARGVATRRRVVVRARDGVAVLLPAPFPLMIGSAIDTIEKFLVISQRYLLSL